MRPEPYATPNRRSLEHKGDRMANRPQTLRSLLRWARRAYEMETPPLDHSAVHVALDGDPEMRPETQRYLALSGQPDDRPDDWRIIAGRTSDGAYVTPMRRAIEGIRATDRQRGDFLASLVIHVFHDKDVTRMYGIPDWCAGDVVFRSLSLLWDRYCEVPIPRRPPPTWVEKSESQQHAEDAA